MEPNENGYHISFFRPTTPNARRNRNMVVQLFLIWFFAIFGFQVLLRVLQKPVPEPALEKYSVSWNNIKEGEAGREDLQAFASSILQVLGKLSIVPADREALDHAFSWALYQLADSAQKIELGTQVAAFRKSAAEITDIANPEYLAVKNELISFIQPLLGTESSNPALYIAPLEIVPEAMEEYTDEHRNTVEAAMPFYLTHNRSVLTDTRFLGFPFHYFYTAIFLLVLFVGLCWLYCIRTDYFNRKYGMEI